MKRAFLLAAAIGAGTSGVASTAHGADAKGECIAGADQGQALRDEGHYRRAREAFATCARAVCPPVVVRSCTQWTRELEDAMPTVVLGAKDAAGQDLASVRVTSDGAPLVDALDGRPVDLDPGPHVLRFESAGAEPAEASIVLHTGEKNRAVNVTLRAMGAAAAPSGAPTPAETAAASPGPETWGARNVVGLSLLVLGGAAIGTGVVLLTQSGSQSSTAAGLRSGMTSYACTDNPSSSTCQQLSDAVDAQHRDSNLGTVALVGGSVLAVAAVVTWLVWPRSEEPASSTTTGLRWLGPGRIGGTF
jgi:hypothetical protein